MHLKLYCQRMLAAALAICAGLVQAAGFAVNEQAASSLGSAYAGRASHADNASIASANPAGIARLDQQQVTLGSALVLQGGEFTGAYTGQVPGGANALSGASKNYRDTMPVPFGYYVLPLQEKWTVGLSSYVPFGIYLDYDDDFPGKYFADKTAFSVINVQGTLAYRLRDDLAVGVGLIGAYTKGELTKLVNMAAGTDTKGTMTGDAFGYSWNIGVTWQATDRTAVGLSYHAQTDLKLKGTSELNNIPPGASNLKSNATLAVTMPEQVLFSTTHRVNPHWTVMADVTWTRWSRMDEMVINADNPQLSTYDPKNWRNTWALSIGAAYAVNNAWTLKAGYMFDQSPVTDTNRTARAPDADRNWLTAGAKWTLNSDLALDFAYAYVMMKDGAITEQQFETDRTVNTAYGTLTGTYKNRIHLLAAQLTYRF